MTKSAPAAAIAAVPTKDLKTEEPSLAELGSLLGNPDQTESLMLATKYYRDFFEEFWDACYQLSTYQDITYLIDFDVLRAYLQVDSVQDFDAFFLDSLFTESTKNYAFPAGTLSELFDYIKKLTRTTKGMASLDFSAPQSFVRQLAAFLGVESASDGDLGELGEEIILRLASTSMQLSKLYEILTNPRFGGVVSDHDEGDLRILEQILDRMPRPKGERSDRDHRDAINLAIAIKSGRRQPRGLKKGYILLTNTKIVQKLPRMILEHIDNNQERAEMLKSLATILGFNEERQAFSTPRGSDLSFQFPALHPSMVVNAEMQGVFADDSDLFLDKVQKLQNESHNVTNFFRTRATNLIRHGRRDGGGRVRPELVPELDEAVIQSLVYIATEMMSVRGKGLLPVEQRRVTAVSVAYTRQQQTGAPLSNYDELTQKSTELLKLFGQLIAAIEGAAGFRYVVESDQPVGPRPFEPFRILQEPAPDGQAPLAVGEKYTAGGPHGPRQSFYAIRWPIAARPEKFLQVMKRLVVPLLKDPRPASRPMLGEIPLARVGEDSPLRREGVIVFANDRAFGLPLEAFPYPNSWDRLRPNRLASELKVHLEQECRARGGLEAPSTHIQQYRVNTMFGAFIFDIELAEDEPRRYFTVISHYNLTRQLALLYAETGLFYVFSEKLAGSVAPAFAEFQELPASTPTKESP
jgi:hypothetical protein